MANPRFEVPGFPDPPLLQQLIDKVRLRRFNGLVITGILAIAVAGFVGWVFSASKILERRAWCERDAAGMKSAKQLCERRYDELVAEGVSSPSMKCGEVSKERSAFEYCLDPEGSGSSIGNEQRQFGLLAVGLTGFGLLLIALGVTWRIYDVPAFLAVLREPRRITWIYESSTISGAYGMWHGIVLALDDKQRVEILIGEGRPDVAYSQRVLATLAAWAPWAAVGYSEEMKARFANDPSSLRTAS